jgi:hypothetical protein
MDEGLVSTDCMPLDQKKTLKRFARLGAYEDMLCFLPLALIPATGNLKAQHRECCSREYLEFSSIAKLIRLHLKSESTLRNVCGLALKSSKSCFGGIEAL